MPSKILNILKVAILFICVLLAGCKQDSKLQSKNALNNLIEKAEDPTVNSQKRITLLDSLSKILSKTSNDSVSRGIYRRLSAAYFNLNRLDKSFKASAQVYNLAKEAKDTVSMGKASYLQGLYYYQIGTKEEALHHYRQAEKLYKAIDYPDLGTVILYQAYIYYDAGEYVMAESEGTKALKIFREQNMYFEQYQCLVMLAAALNEQANAEESIRYYQLAIQQAEKLKNSGFSEEDIESYKIICVHNLGEVYEKEKLFDKAETQYKLVLSSPVIHRDNIMYSRAMYSIAKVRLLEGKLNGIREMLINALALSDSIKDKQGVVLGNLRLADFYNVSRDTSKAIGFYKKTYGYATEINSNPEVLKALKGLAATDLENSHRYSAQYFKLNDSLQNITLQNRNKYARIEYETDQLQDQNNELLRKNSFIIGISVVILLFVAAIFIIYYLNSRNKELILTQEQQKASEEIYQLMFEQQHKVEVARSEEKNRIAMELHDGILNNIYAVRLNLEFTNRKTDAETIEKRKEYIKELQALEAEIRSVSHDLSRSANLVEGKDFGAMLYFMVISQKNNFNTEFEFILDKDIDWDSISNTLKVNIYRIVQESLQNINKYSHASHAFISISKIDDNQLLVIVKDDGIGFDVKKAGGGIGLKNLKKRAEALNGLFEIASENGKGTTVTVQLSIQ